MSRDRHCRSAALCAAFCAVVLASCVTVPPKTRADFRIAVTADKDLAGVTVGVVDVAWTRFPFGEDGAIAGIVLSINNQSQEAISIDWASSSVGYEEKTFLPFLGGMRYSDAGKAPPSTRVAPGTSVTVEVYSSAQPHDSAGKGGGWYMGVMSNDVRLTLCVEQGAERQYSTIGVALLQRRAP